MASQDIVVSGMRPTGRLHLGNYWGALRNWVDLQNSYRCYFFVADWHMLTTGYDDTSKLQENTREMVLDWLGAGLDPEKCVIFKQSDVPEHAELALMLSMITPLSWLENNPTWKEQLQELSRTKLAKAVEAAGGKVAVQEKVEAAESDFALRTHGFLGYPVLQAADVLLYKGSRVPVGQDQLPHIELTREIARKFNSAFGAAVLPEPKPLITQTPKLPGVDGRKMSKSYGNAVEMNESKESLASKVMAMYTDPKKIRKDTPGNPEPGPENPPGCVVYALHKLYSDKTMTEKVLVDCKAGSLGCVADKRELLLPNLEKSFEAFRAQREKFSGKKVDEVLAHGAEKARKVAQQTMKEVRRAMKVSL